MEEHPKYQHFEAEMNIDTYYYAMKFVINGNIYDIFLFNNFKSLQHVCES